MESMRFQVLIERDEDGLYVAEVPSLQACCTQGETFEEVMENIKEVIAMCIQEMREDGELEVPRFPEVISIETVEVLV